MLEQRQLKALIKLMVDNDLTELELQDPQGERVALKRGGQVHAAPVAALPAATSSAPPPAAGSVRHAGLVPIPSPMVGTFYSAASPDAPPLAGAGMAIRPESVVCIIEAMKVFNEIKADLAGTIVEVLVTNGQAVEFGQALFMVRPA
jgi:acetyl-CoA carboxylase biotin carboxyl carrier protein